ncbi:MAG: hypothetical protein HY821_10755 [Acidobacteria bacterium]|nr:hypothetical protein [Acidobacteriota bacterium]
MSLLFNSWLFISWLFISQLSVCRRRVCDFLRLDALIRTAVLGAGNKKTGAFVWRGLGV